MAFEADWSLDFCLACDKQSTEGPYCSIACRLSDMERSGSPRSHSSTDSSPSSSFGHGFHLPPAIDFATYKPAATSQSVQATASPSKRNSLVSVDTNIAATVISRRDSNPNSPGVSLPAATRHELEQYENAFDSARHRRHQQVRRS